VPEETMDTEAQIEALNAALRLQMRSALQYTLAAGSMFGFEYQGLRRWLPRGSSRIHARRWRG